MDPHGVDLHALRYSFGTRLYHAGVDIKTVQTLLGHKTAKITMDIYVKSDDRIRSRAVERLPFLKRAAFRLHGEGSASVQSA